MHADEQDVLDVVTAAAVAGDRLALIEKGRSRTFAELADWVAKIVAEAALSPGTVVSYPAPPSANGVAASLAVLLGRWVGVPLHHRLGESAWTVVERRAGVAFRLTLDVDGRAHLTNVGDRVVDSGKAGAPGESFRLLSSGTTGTPKVIRLGRAALVAALALSEAHLGWEELDRWLLCMPLAHVGGLSIVTRCLAARKAVIVRPRFSPADVEQAVKEEGATMLSVVPVMLERLVDDVGTAPAGLRIVLVGGAAAREELLVRARRLGWPALATYGMTEACSQLTCQRREGAVDRWPTRGVGQPLPGVAIRIRPLADDQLAVGMLSDRESVGVIEARTPARTMGSLGGPIEPADAWLDTGDCGTIEADGTLRVVGRIREIIITGGENVLPQPIEEHLRSCPAVADACVIGWPDERWGQIVVAVVVATNAADGSPDEPSARKQIREACAEMPSFMRPRRLLWVRDIDALMQSEPRPLKRSRSALVQALTGAVSGPPFESLEATDV